MSKHSGRISRIALARESWTKGNNIGQILRNETNLENTEDIIEIMYDMQAGSYINQTKQNPDFLRSYASQYANILKDYIYPESYILDIGCGELTTLCYILKDLYIKPKGVLAFDSSWSRIHKGLRFAREELGADSNLINAFVGNMSEIAFSDKSIDFVISNHALEPNRMALEEIMIELFRITSEKLFLFEPWYEGASRQIQKRMDMHGYIKGIKKVVSDLKGSLIDVLELEVVSNPENPTTCFIISPPSAAVKSTRSGTKPAFTIPGTNYHLSKIGDWYFSKEIGLAYPTLENIPILNTNHAVLASALNEEK